MGKIIMLALLAGGIILLVFGINASQSAGSEISQIFTGSPTDRALWMIISGAVAIVIGLGGFIRGMMVKHWFAVQERFGSMSRMWLESFIAQHFFPSDGSGQSILLIFLQQRIIPEPNFYWKKVTSICFAFLSPSRKFLINDMSNR